MVYDMLNAAAITSKEHRQTKVERRENKNDLKSRWNGDHVTEAWSPAVVACVCL